MNSPVASTSADEFRITPRQVFGVKTNQTRALALVGDESSLSNPAPRLDGLGALLFAPAVAMGASRPGARVSGVWHLGPMGGPQITFQMGLCGTVSWRRRLVDLDSSFPLPSVAAGRCSHATCVY